MATKMHFYDFFAVKIGQYLPRTFRRLPKDVPWTSRGIPAGDGEKEMIELLYAKLRYKTDLIDKTIT